MTREDQLGMPPLDVMRQVLADNLPLVRLLAACSDSTPQGGPAQPETHTGEQVQLVEELFSTYCEVLQLLEILSATAVPVNSSSRREDDPRRVPAKQ